MPSLVEIRASGASNIDVADAIPTPADLAIDLSGAVHLEGTFSAVGFDLRVADASTIAALLGARSAQLHASGASTSTSIGVVDSVTLELSGASNGSLRDFETRLASLDLNGASSAEITVTERITRLNLAGASRLDYFGNAVVDSQTVTGDSRLNAR